MLNVQQAINAWEDSERANRAADNYQGPRPQQVKLILRQHADRRAKDAVQLALKATCLSEFVNV
jgi:hypothetical protein